MHDMRLARTASELSFAGLPTELPRGPLVDEGGSAATKANDGVMAQTA